MEEENSEKRSWPDDKWLIFTAPVLTWLVAVLQAPEVLLSVCALFLPVPLSLLLALRTTRRWVDSLPIAVLLSLPVAFMCYVVICGLSICGCNLGGGNRNFH